MVLASFLPGCSAGAPPEPSSVENLEQELYRQLVEDSRASLLSLFPGAEVPEVDRVRFIAADEWAKTMASCLAEQGFGVRMRDDGGIDYDIPAAGQEEALAVADYVCSLQYPVARTAAAPTGEELRMLYDYYVEELGPCLEEEGFSVPRAPSFTAFEESYASSPWSPYAEVQPATEDAWSEINAACPQLPPDLGGSPVAD